MRRGLSRRGLRAVSGRHESMRLPIPACTMSTAAQRAATVLISVESSVCISALLLLSGASDRPEAVGSVLDIVERGQDAALGGAPGVTRRGAHHGEALRSRDAPVP